MRGARLTECLAQLHQFVLPSILCKDYSHEVILWLYTGTVHSQLPDNLCFGLTMFIDHLTYDIFLPFCC
jgi:hypothetical protein